MIRTVTASLSFAGLLVACGAGTPSDGHNVAESSKAAPFAQNTAQADVAASANSASTTSPDLAGARRLIDSIYAPYVRDEINSDPSRTFTPELAAAIRSAGENAMNADPFCDCQDFGEFSYTIQSVGRTAEGANVRVSISSFGESRIIPIRLAHRRGTWMVADVGEGPASLTQMMARAPGDGG